MKKVLSLVLSVVMLFGITAGLNLTAEAAAMGKVKSVSVISVGENSVKLKWKKVNKAAGYQIFCSTKKSKGYKKVKTVKNGKTVKATVKKLDAGKKYYFKVRAVKGKKKSAFSKPAAAKITGGKSEILNKLLRGYLYQPWAQDTGIYEYVFKADGTYRINDYVPIYKNGKITKNWERWYFEETKQYGGESGKYTLNGNKITIYHKNTLGTEYTQDIYYDSQMGKFRSEFFAEDADDEAAETYFLYIYRTSKLKVSKMNSFYNQYAESTNYVPNP